MSIKAEAAESGTDREAALAALYDDIARHNMFPFWAGSREKAHDEIARLMATPRAVPHVWRYGEIEPLLRRAAQLVSMDDSERRSLILINPGLAPRRASVPTMYTAYRLNDPGEIMPPHRHSPSAIRFGLTGTGNFTGVEGENVVFGPGDMVLTPNDAWHNHGTVGDEPAINLSVLDLPLVEALGAVRFEHDYTETVDGRAVARKVQTPRYAADYSQAVYGRGGMVPRFADHRRGGGTSSPMWVYRWEEMEAILERFRDFDGAPHEGVTVEYTDPVHGGPVFSTMTFYVQMLRPGERTLPLCQTANLLAAPFRGAGHSIIDGMRHDWSQFDTLAIPAGAWVEHVNPSPGDPVILFVASDEPVQKALRLYRKLGRDAAGDLVELA
ncbi:MAG: cupin domain-containing protein [Alphaproteobacteria bacterium]|nr:MAG: cupin domain-containing protein [Alphaproteobacteria bacterium]